jgi:signal transduction histidine kinase
MNLVASVTEEPFLVRGDAKQLQQVVTNLLLNAAEASAPGAVNSG